MRYVYLDEQASGILNHEGEFSVRRGFAKGAYLAVLAYEAGKLVGAFRAYWQTTPSTLEAAGTWVAPSHRRAGLARKLWARMLRETRPRSVEVMTISRGGARLVRALKQRYPKIRWSHKKR